MKTKLSSIFKTLGVNATFTNTVMSKPQFMIKEGLCKLEAQATDTTYSMKIVNNKGKILDHMSCSIDSDADLQNRITESITTLTNISKLFDSVRKSDFTHENTKLVKSAKVGLTEDEDDPEDNIDIDIDNVNDSTTPNITLDDFYQNVVNLAQQALTLADTLFTQSDAEHQAICLGFAGNLYSLAEDIAELQDDLTPETDEDSDKNNSTKESISRNHKCSKPGNVSKKFSTRKTLSMVDGKLAEALTIIKNDKNSSDAYIKTLRSVIRDIRTDITVNS